MQRPSLAPSKNNAYFCCLIGIYAGSHGTYIRWVLMQEALTSSSLASIEIAKFSKLGHFDHCCCLAEDTKLLLNFCTVCHTCRGLLYETRTKRMAKSPFICFFIFYTIFSMCLSFFRHNNYHAIIRKHLAYAVQCA